MMDELVPWLRKRIDMAVQCADALPNAVGNLLSQFSPTRLYCVHTMHGLLLNSLLKRKNDPAAQRDIQILAMGYRLCPGFKEEWLPRKETEQAVTSR